MASHDLSALYKNLDLCITIATMANLSFEEHDKLHRVEFAQHLTDSIERFYPFADDAYVLSLDAPFGSGKTMFVRMWRTYLANRDPAIESIYFNAWKYDYYDDPAIPLLVELLKKVEDNSPEEASAFRKMLAVATIGLNETSKQLTGIDPVALGKTIKQMTEDEVLEKLGGNLYEAFKEQQNVMENASKALKSYVEGLDKKPLFIFIDELDRARPDYAVKLLETLKHLFGVKGVCFVLAVDKRHLASSVRTMYGHDLDFENYYKKFVTRQFTLPSIEEAPLESFIEACFYENFDEKMAEGVVFPFSDGEKSTIRQSMHFMALAMQLSPRQIKEYFRTVAHFLAVSHDLNDGRRPSTDDLMLVCLIQAIEVHSTEFNLSLIEDNCDERDFTQILEKIKNSDYTEPNYDCHEFVYRFSLIFVTSLTFDGNVTQMAQLLSRYADDTISDAQLRQHVGNHRYRLPQPNLARYRVIGKKMRYWRPFIG